MNVSEKMVEILAEEGVENIFGIPGEQIMPFYKALSSSKIPWLKCFGFGRCAVLLN